MKYEETLFFLSQNITNQKEMYEEQINRLIPLIKEVLSKSFSAKMTNIKKNQLIKEEVLSVEFHQKDTHFHLIEECYDLALYDLLKEDYCIDIHMCHEPKWSRSKEDYYYEVVWNYQEYFNTFKKEATHETKEPAKVIIKKI